MTPLSENELETRDRLYDRLICGEDWELLAEVLDGHMPLAVARLVAFIYCNPRFYGPLGVNKLIGESDDKVAELIEDYIRTWKPPERGPTEGEIMDYVEKHR